MTMLGSRLERGRAPANTARTGAWLWLTVPVAILVAIATVSELLADGLFRDNEYLVAQAIGQDFVTLLVALPALVAGAVLAARGSARARLVWLGALVYLVYTYTIYAFAMQFNPLFLVYVALLGCSLYALIGGLATTDFEGLKARFSRRTPAKAVSVFLAIIAAAFYLLWLGEVVPALLAGDVPQSVVDNGTPTNAVHVMDMAWVLPAMALTAVWLWRGRAIGYALAGILLTFMPLLVTAIMAMVVSMALFGQAVAFEPVMVFGVVAAISTAMLVWYLRELGGKPRVQAAPNQEPEHL